MSGIYDEIDAYEAIQTELESMHMGKWVMVKDRRLVGAYESFDSAASDAIRQFGRGPYLIRQVGASRLISPPSFIHYTRDAQR